MVQPQDINVEDFGLANLTPEAKDAAIHDIYLTLQRRIGMRLANEMTEEQLKIFETLKGEEDQAKFDSWLTTTFPNLDTIAEEELQGIKDETHKTSSSIMDAYRAKKAAEGQSSTPQN